MPCVHMHLILPDSMIILSSTLGFAIIVNQKSENVCFLTKRASPLWTLAPAVGFIPNLTTLSRAVLSSHLYGDMPPKLLVFPRTLLGPLKARKISSVLELLKNWRFHGPSRFSSLNDKTLFASVATFSHQGTTGENFFKQAEEIFINFWSSC